MTSTIGSLWPAAFGAGPLPEPVTILREQGDELRYQTQGLLYGDVDDGPTPSSGGLRYEFFLGVSRHAYRYDLLTVECGPLNDYPVTVGIIEAGTATRIHDREGFVSLLQTVFNAPAVTGVLERMRLFALGRRTVDQLVGDVADAVEARGSVRIARTDVEDAAGMADRTDDERVQYAIDHLRDVHRIHQVLKDNVDWLEFRK